jgi:IS5 family transposase
MVVKTGTLVDATLIASASIKTDDEARWAGHRRKTAVHGYKAHIATDKAGGLVRSLEVTTANVHDGIMLEAVLPPEPGKVYADSAYAAGRFTDVIQARGGVPRVVHTYTWGGPDALARLEAWNAAVRALRCRIEKVFGTCKRSYGLRRMRRLGLAKSGLQVRLRSLPTTSGTRRRT